MDHLAMADQYRRPLDAECATQDEALELRLRADQGEALRGLLYHLGAAIVEALKSGPWR